MTPRPPLLAPADTDRRYGVVAPQGTIRISNPFRMYLADVCVSHSTAGDVQRAAEARLKLPSLGSNREATGVAARGDTHFTIRRLLAVVRETPL